MLSYSSTVRVTMQSLPQAGRNSLARGSWQTFRHFTGRGMASPPFTFLAYDIYRIARFLAYVKNAKAHFLAFRQNNNAGSYPSWITPDKLEVQDSFLLLSVRLLIADKRRTTLTAQKRPNIPMFTELEIEAIFNLTPSQFAKIERIKNS